MTRSPLLLLAALTGLALPAAAQTVTEAPSPGYQAGALKRALFGPEYRELWTSPIAVPILILDSLSPGLRPVSRSGGEQTLGLRLRATDGREFFFRSLDKDPSAALPPELRHTIISDVIRDQTSSAFPTAPLVVDRLATAIGLPHPTPHLVVLPDDSTLGEFRKDFAGTLGIVEDRIGGKGVNGVWNGAAEIIDNDTLLAWTTRSHQNRVDGRAFLRARLFDVYIGDWDRHRDQWRWARYGESTMHRWQPVPLDRDQAFVKYDGLLLGAARQTAPQLLNFSNDIAGPVGATWNGRELDRRYLVELEKPVWDSVAAEIQAALTDAVIDSAIRALPPQHYDLIATRLRGWLLARRTALPAAAERFRQLLAKQVDVHATATSDHATFARTGAEIVTLTIADSTGAPWFRRAFHTGETEEVRLFLGDGPDTAVALGNLGGLTLRILGEGGIDRLVDSARQGTQRWYDEPDGPVRTAGLASGVDRRPFVIPPSRDPRALPPRDWGNRRQYLFWSSFGPDLGFFFGTGVTFTRYGFHKVPFATRHRLRAGYATGPQTARIDYLGQFRRENSELEADLMLRISGIEINRFHGFGNDTKAPKDDEFYRVTSNQYLVAPSLSLPLIGPLTLKVGPELKYVSTDERSNRYLSTVALYGEGSFGELGGRAALVLDATEGGLARTHGVALELGGSIHPALWDVRETFGDVYGVVSTYLTPRGGFQPTLALRAGGRRIWGAFPYFDAAFIGGPESVRLGRESRFAGDASVYGSSELRVPVGRVVFLVPSEFGVVGLADIGRVFLAGESSDSWHSAVGGGVWLGLLGRSNAVSVVVAKSEERTRLYVQAGFGF